MHTLPAGTAPYLRLRQVCLVAPQLAPAVQAVRAVFGLPVCYRDPNVAAFGLENALFALGQSFLEIVAPTRPDTAAGRFLQRSGGVGGYMLIFDCDDPARYRNRAAVAGVRVAYEIDHPGYRGVQLHPRDCRAAMLEFDHTDGGEPLDGPYHPAGPTWQAARRPERVQALRCAEVETPDPAGLAAHWAGLMGVPAQADPAGATTFTFDAGALRIQAAPAGTPERLSGLQVQVGDPAAVLAAAAAAGLRVAQGRLWLCGVWIEPALA